MEVTEAVKEVLQQIKMFRAINCINVTLIRKVQNPSSIKEHRLIACCTMLYKLTSRLQKNMTTLIDNTKAAFVFGRTITDNILLSHELVKGYGRKNMPPRCFLMIDMQKPTTL